MPPAPSVLWWTCQNVVVTAALAGVVWAACRALRLGPVGRHALWLIVLVKLLTPPLVVWPWAVHAPLGWAGVGTQPLPAQVAITAPPADSTVAQPATAAPPPETVAADVVYVSTDVGSVADGNPIAPTPPAAAAAVPPPSIAPPACPVSPAPAALPSALPPPSWAARMLPRALVIVAVAWVLGAAAFALVQGVRIVRMHLWLRRSRPAGGPLVDRVAEMARRLGVRPVRVRLLDGIGSPMVWGLGRPVMLWPGELPVGTAEAAGTPETAGTPSLSENAARGLIVHELAHVKRRDHWVGWLELLAGCLWWWNPLFWYVRHQLRENAELACDGWVVDTLPKARRAYAEGLLAVCECLAGRRPARAPAAARFAIAIADVVAGRPVPMPTVGVGTGGRRFIERRLAMILRDRVPLRLPRIGLAIVALLCLAAVPVFSRAEADDGKSAREDAGPAARAADRLKIANDQLDRVLVLEGRRTAAAPGAGLSLYGSRAAQPLPQDVQEVVRQFQQQRAEAERELQQKLARQREEMVQELKKLQDKHTKAGELDEAVAIRDYIRRLQAGGGPNATGVRVGVGGGDRVDFTRPVRVQPDPGTMVDYRDRVGQTFAFEVVGSIVGTVWGTDVYTDDSPVSEAAVHAGLLSSGQRGVVRVTVLPGRDHYDGTTRNGVQTLDYGSWQGSYRFETAWARADGPRGGGGIAVAQPPQPDPGVLTTFRDRVGQTLTFEVTGSDQGTVWGSDVFTDDSPLAVAAVHVGQLRVGQKGTVRVKILPGRQSYEGTTRNRITSLPYGPWDGSYQFEQNAIRLRLRLDKDGGARLEGPIEGVLREAPDLQDLRGKAGTSFDVELTGSATAGSVWGGGGASPDVYTDDSSLAAAAVHAGALKDGEKGVVRVTVLPGQDSYGSSDRNGVSTGGWQQWGGSFRVERVDRATAEMKVTQPAR